ncbi:MAG TPA: mechanosensitive ion channel family protein [Steroidobacteraceae bacterium]|nr:mechanosensitive ion channel family protein [Steroidobacteraceae bacterium]
MFDFDQWRDAPIFHNSLTAWLIAGSIAATVFVILFGVRLAIRRYAKRLKATTDRTEFLEIPMLALCRTALLFMLIVAVAIGSQSLKLGDTLQRVITSALFIAFFWQVGLWLAAAVRAWVEGRRAHGGIEDRAALSSLDIIRFIASVVIWSLVLLLTLDNLGVNITALVAGLGVGGIAVALATQNVLGDLFASLSIALDRPFVVGDFLAVDAYLGAVENIGIKSTRLRSLDGEQIILSNGDLLKSRVRNYGRMVERRVQFTVGVAYTTPVSQLEQIPGWIREFITREKDTRFDRSHFSKHGASALEFETVYYVLSADYNRYMDIQQSINLNIQRRFAEQGIAFAVTTQNMVFARAAQALNPEQESAPPEKAAAAPDQEERGARRKQRTN